MENTDPVQLEAIPWEQGDFFSEEGFGKASEFFFQTHAKFSQTIQQARQATGIAKASQRWKLTKEIGEDYWLYTGLKIGEKAPADNKQPLGIRGELNHLLAANYKKISPNTPIQSRVQQDLTIVSHPLGVLEVCFGLSHFYKALTRRYASFGAGRRVALKGLMDEEVFKWIWRLYYSSVLKPPDEASDYYDQFPSTGLAYIPLEQQRFTSPEKTFAIAQMLLGEHLAGSHLRGPLCFYFVEFLRSTQYRLLPQAQRSRLEKAFEQANLHKVGDGVDDMLVAIDVSLNATGPSKESFDDLVGDGDEAMAAIVVQAEQDFITDHQDFSSQRFADTMEKFLPPPPDPTRPSQDAVSLMPIVLVLRAASPGMAERILKKIPGPLLNFIVNRLRFSGADVVSQELMQRTATMIETRRQAGERYVIPTRADGAVVMSNSGAQAAAPAKVVGGTAKNEAPAPPPQRPPAPQQSWEDLAGGYGADAGGSDSDEASRQPPGSAAPPAEADNGRQGSGAAELAEPSRVVYRGVADVRLVVGWQVRDGALSMQSLSPRQICEYTGFESYCMVPWAVFALQSGQIAQRDAAKISKETVDGVVRSMRDEIDSDAPGLFPEAERDQLRAQCRQMAGHQVLRLLHDCIVAGAAQPPASRAMAVGARLLGSRMGAELENFLRNPGDPAYSQQAQKLSREEKYVAVVLNRVNRIAQPS
ncbi:MAG: hypothetical protein V3S29_06845 [bacterium]